MRIDLDLPDDKKFQDNLDAALKASNRTRKNFLETLIIAAVNQNDRLFWQLYQGRQSKKKDEK